MIICFSGTGNSRRVADRLQDILGDEIVRLAPGLMLDPSRVELIVSDGRVIWVMPTHCWGLPKTVRKVIRQAHISGEDGMPIEHYLVMTCGDDIGNADLQWRRDIRHLDGTAVAAFSVQMPNTYTFMRGFDVDAAEVAKAKLDAMPQRVDKIAEMIEASKPVTDVVRGKYAWIKTNIIYPWFMAFKSSTIPFHANNQCTGCGVCAANCPVLSISIVDGRPQWGKNCTMCVRCYHACPRHAVEYGKATRDKGQYICPGFPLAAPKKA